MFNIKGKRTECEKDVKSCFSSVRVVRCSARSVNTMERPNAWKNYNKTDLKNLEETAKEYRQFIDAGKTERECATYAVSALEKAGYISLGKAVSEGKKLKAGDKVYLNQMGKAILVFLIGKKPCPTGRNSGPETKYI